MPGDGCQCIDLGLGSAAPGAIRTTKTTVCSKLCARQVSREERGHHGRLFTNACPTTKLLAAGSRDSERGRHWPAMGGVGTMVSGMVSGMVSRSCGHPLFFEPQRPT